MPLDNEGFFHAKSQKTLSPRTVMTPLRSKIARWPAVKRVAFERELIAQQLSIEKIAKKYGVAYQTAINWKLRVLKPAMAAAAQQQDIEERGMARQYLDWLLETNKSSITDLKENKASPKVHGTIAQQLGQGASLVRMLGDLTGEFAEAESVREKDKPPAIIRCIVLPKIGEAISMDVQVAIPTRHAAALPPAQDDSGDA
jgi:hypothetical protein